MERPWQKFYNDPFVSKMRILNGIDQNALGGRGHVWGRVPPRFTIREFKAKMVKKTDYKWPFKIEEINKIYKEIEKTLIYSLVKKIILDLIILQPFEKKVVQHC